MFLADFEIVMSRFYEHAQGGEFSDAGEQGSGEHKQGTSWLTVFKSL